MSAPDWLPDWRDADAYPRPEDLSFCGWAWEFMRRSAEYQADYRRWIATSTHAKAHQGELDDAPATVVADCDPPALEGESVAQYKRRLYFEGRAGGVSYVPHCFRPKYLTDLPPPDPSQKTQPPLFFGSQCFQLGPGAVDQLSDESRFVFSFNLDEPAEAQFAKARRMFDREQRRRGTTEKRRNHFDKYPLYLRILDADAAGAARQEMAEVLFPYIPNEYPAYQAAKRVDDTLRAAKEMMNGGYRELIYQQETRQK